MRERERNRHLPCHAHPQLTEVPMRHLSVPAENITRVTNRLSMCRCCVVVYYIGVDEGKKQRKKTAARWLMITRDDRRLVGWPVGLLAVGCLVGLCHCLLFEWGEKGSRAIILSGCVPKQPARQGAALAWAGDTKQDGQASGLEVTSWGGGDSGGLAERLSRMILERASPSDSFKSR